MSLTKIEQALLTEIASIFPTTSIEYENAPVTPTAGAKWIQVFSIPTTPRVDTLGTAGQDRVDGIMQLSIHYPLSTGNSAYNTDYETVRSHCPAGYGLTYSGQTVQITNVGKSTGRKRTADFVGDISINWYAFIPR